MARRLRVASTSIRRRGGGGAAANPLLTGLLAYYKFSSLGVDSTGNWSLDAVNTPTYSSTAPAVSGETGQYAILEQGAAQMRFESSTFNALDGATKVTWMFFVKYDSTSGFQGISGQWLINANTSNWLIYNRGPGKHGLFAGRSDTGYTQCEQTTGDGAGAGVWMHFRITLDTTLSGGTTQCEIYKNGSQLSLTASNDFTALQSNDLDMLVGGYGDLSYGLDGRIDEFGIWDRIVSDADAELHRLATDLPY
jgi:hypothetical protein